MLRDGGSARCFLLHSPKIFPATGLSVCENAILAEERAA